MEIRVQSIKQKRWRILPYEHCAVWPSQPLLWPGFSEAAEIPQIGDMGDPLGTLDATQTRAYSADYLVTNFFV
jgi:hypothetical protein